MVECVPDEQILSHYKGCGRASYHPKMMLIIILHGCIWQSRNAVYDSMIA